MLKCYRSRIQRADTGTNSLSDAFITNYRPLAGALTAAILIVGIVSLVWMHPLRSTVNSFEMIEYHPAAQDQRDHGHQLNEFFANFFTSSLVQEAYAERKASVWTDKDDYLPTEPVIITGSGFLPSATITVSITRPDLVIDTRSTTSDSSGSFTVTYNLDGIPDPVGEYFVSATDGTNTATATFTDGNRTFDQCDDDANGDNNKDPCVWTRGTINAGDSAYREGDSNVGRVWLDGLEPGSTGHTITFRYDFTKKTSGGQINLGYDFITHPDATETATAQRCTGIPGSIGVSAAQCAAMSGPNTFTVLPTADAFVFSSGLTGVNSALAGQAVSDRITASSALKQIVIYGGTITGVSSISKVGDPNTDSATLSEFTATFSVGTGSGAACVTKQSETTCSVLVMVGFHLASSANAPAGWGPDRGASDFPGSSLSMRLESVDGDSTGAVNRSIQPDAIIPPARIGPVFHWTCSRRDCHMHLHQRKGCQYYRRKGD
jgi:hypothetical protein